MQSFSLAHSIAFCTARLMGVVNAGEIERKHTGVDDSGGSNCKLLGINWAD